MALFQGLEMLTYYFICSEIGVVNFLHRRFDWSANSLWYEELPHAKDPSRYMFVLAGKDFIVNSDVSVFSPCFGWWWSDSAVV